MRAGASAHVSVKTGRNIVEGSCKTDRPAVGRADNRLAEIWTDECAMHGETYDCALYRRDDVVSSLDGNPST